MKWEEQGRPALKSITFGVLKRIYLFNYSLSLQWRIAVNLIKHQGLGSRDEFDIPPFHKSECSLICTPTKLYSRSGFTSQSGS